MSHVTADLGAGLKQEPLKLHEFLCEGPCIEPINIYNSGISVLRMFNKVSKCLLGSYISIL